jgi:uncharacterized protein (DUF302 family)
VLGTHDLKQKMREKGVDYDRDCLVFEVCNPMKAKRVLEENQEIATMLPCRIAAYRTDEGKTRLSTLRPTRLVELFRGDLQQVAGEVEETLDAIMRQAAALAPTR